MLRLMGHAPAVLESYLKFTDAFQKGNRRLESTDEKIRLALQLAATVIHNQGNVPAAEVSALREVGYSDAEIVEIVAFIGLGVFRNYFNLVLGTEVDFPLVGAMSSRGAA